MDGMTWTTKWDYDAMDRVASQTYPDNNTVSFIYNTMGQLDNIPSILSSIDYNERGQEIKRNYANGLGTVFDYNPLNQRLSKITTTGAQNYIYGYDNAGNVKTINDAINNRTETFTYDDLDRLVNAEDPGSNGYKNTYAYNAIGNMLAETDVKNGATSVAQYTYGLGGAGPHAVTGKSDTKPVLALFSLSGGKAYSTTQTVTLNNIALGNPSEYLASENADFSGAMWKSYSSSPTFSLSNGFGPKTVYFKVRNTNGETSVKSADISYLIDSIGDGIPDIYNPDKDKDGIPDAWEIAQGIDQNVLGHALLDPDHDGLTNIQEYQNGTNPNKVDTDDDGWSDYDEIFNLHTNPNSKGFDNVHNGVSENYSLQLGRFNQGGIDTRASSSHAVSDTLGTAISENALPDSDGDGIPDIIDPDANNDGIPDAWAKANGFNPLLPGLAQLDPDHDGLTNLQEYLRGTNPNKADTNGDGWSDYEEIFNYHIDPNIIGIDNVHDGVSESYSLASAGFTMGSGNRSANSTTISDKIGSLSNNMALNSNGDVSVNPTMIDFGVTDANGQLSQVTVTNMGSQNLAIGVITVDGDNRLEFTTLNDTCSNVTIAPSGSCTVSVRFMPAFTGAKGARLRIRTDGSQTPTLSVNLSGIAGATVIDQTPPSAAMIAINNGVSVTNSRQVNLTLSAQDASGIAGMCISNSNVCSDWETFAGSKTWTLPDIDGAKSVYVWFRDSLGNANFTPQTATITLDTQSPTVTPSVRGGIYNATQIVALSANEPSTIYYTLNGTNPSTASSIYTTPLSVSSNTAIKFFAYDLAGNAGIVQNEQYVIDTTAPTLTVTGPAAGSWTNVTNVTVKGKVTDGLRLNRFTINDADVSLAYDGSFAQPLTLSAGLNQINSVAVDEAGNQSTDSRLVGLDLQAPSIAIGLPGLDEVVYGNSYLIQGNADDGSGSGIQRVEISTDGGLNWVTANGTNSWSTTWQLPPPGNYSIKSRAIDAVGNIGYAADRSVIVRAAYRLDIIFNGTGKGSISSTPFGIGCNSNYWGVFDNGSAITLKADPIYSIFNGWSEACTVTGTGDCLVTLLANTTVTATFTKDTAHQVRLDGTTQTYYSSILSALSDAASGDTVKAWGTDFTENIKLINNKVLTFKGGFDNIDYTTNSGMTVNTGPLTISNGTLKVQKVILRSGMY
ncbi:MAG: chitobiase/beta-hexosaminidase C-terminal domain-containing protein [Desulfobacteraceae bacterium]|nr:chitobiase/beta-hexosaminidase C-terminal domain-containing protein [Desulfobacteraceae bacterium]